MIDNTEDCGCDSQPKKEVTPEDIESIKDKMSQTKDTLETMMTSIKGLNVDLSRFDELENEIKKVSEYMYSGEFFSSLEKMIQSSGHNMANSPFYKDFVEKKQSYFDTMFANASSDELEELRKMGLGKTKQKNPIGYVYVDENGEQKFSPIEPEGIVSTPVYGE